MWFIANENGGGAGTAANPAACAAPASWRIGFSSFTDDAKYDTGPRSTITFAAPVGLPMTLVSTGMWCAPGVVTADKPTTTRLGRAPWRLRARPRERRGRARFYEA